MTEFVGEELPGSRFERVDLSGSTFRRVDLSDADLRGVALHRARMRGVEMGDVEISGEIWGLTVNGVEVTAFVEAELNRRYPQRSLMQPTDPDGFRRAWDVLEELWADTVARAQRLGPGLLHASVDGEWSFIETLRHLLYATDAWVRRVILGDPSPWHPLDLPFDEAPDVAGTPRDRAARPSLAEVLALRRDRRDGVRRFLAGLDQAGLAARTAPVDAPGWPPPQSFGVQECLTIVLTEEWEHRLYAERDLAVLESRGPTAG